MLNAHLIEARESAFATHTCLMAALKSASAVESIVILPLIRSAIATLNGINELAAALESKDPPR